MLIIGDLSKHKKHFVNLAKKNVTEFLEWGFWKLDT